MTEKNVVTTQNLRDYYNADPKRMARLSESDRRTVEIVDGKYPRGRVAPGAVKDHNRYRKVQYVSGATGRAKAAQKAEAAALRAQAREAGFGGERGPLPKAFLQSVSK